MNNLNHFIYIPFINFYEDKVSFAYVPAEENCGSITHGFESAYYSSDIKSAKKVFSSNLRVLCPKDIWENWGLVKMTKQQYLDFNPNLKKDQIGFDYVPVDELLKYEVIKL